VHDESKTFQKHCIGTSHIVVMLLMTRWRANKNRKKRYGLQNIHHHHFPSPFNHHPHILASRKTLYIHYHPFTPTLLNLHTHHLHLLIFHSFITNHSIFKTSK
jgi:hypothetical protein